MLKSPLRSPVRAPFINPIRYDSASDALIARMTTTPTLQRRAAINTLITNLKGSGMWATMDAFYVFAAANEQAARLNWVADQYNITVGGGTPTFVADSHYVGDGVDDFLDTNFNPTTAVSPKFTQDGMHAGVKVLTNLDNAGARDDFFGSTNTFLARTAAVSGGLTWRANRSTSNTATGAFPSHITMRRTSSTSQELWFDDVIQNAASGASAAPSNANFRILRAGGSGHSVNQVRAVHFGTFVFSAQVVSTVKALNAYYGAL